MLDLWYRAVVKGSRGESFKVVARQRYPGSYLRGKLRDGRGDVALSSFKRSEVSGC